MSDDNPHWSNDPDSHELYEDAPRSPAPSSFAASDGSAFAIIETMRQKGYVVQLDNGLDGTWEAQFYKPEPYGKPQKMLLRTYGAGRTLLKAVTEAAENTPNAPGERPPGQPKT
ncbi:MAG TPA: hypothetical protein VFU31_00525 [Candidatus Binatia bacterium]|nr:hypothetical protein [Candidatus Binatia bacterium]